MQLKFIIAALAVCFAPSANAENKPIYFLVDASGSMSGQNLIDAKLLLLALSLPRDQLVSVTYFGRKPTVPGANLCFEQLDVRDAAPRGPDFLADLGDLGGRDDQTAITNAIDKVLNKVSGSAKLIIVTDGQEGCNKNFSDIWDRHPDTNIEIEVRQVGDTPNSELQKLEEGPPAKPVHAPPTPLLNLEFRGQVPSSPPNAWWDAEWPERYFWLLPYVLVAISAGFFGGIYGNAAQRYETETEGLAEIRRDAANYFAQNNAHKPVDWPKFLQASSAMEGSVHAKRISAAFLLLALLAGTPLVLFSGASTEVASAAIWVLPIVAALLVVASALFQHSTKNGRGFGRAHELVADYFPASPTMQIVLIVCIIAVTTIHFAIDGDRARGAAWFVLGSGFSAALAIAASAPILFAGAQRSRLDRAKVAYKSTWDQGLDETHRQSIAEAKKQLEQRDQFLSAFFRLSFPVHDPVGLWRVPNISLRRNKEVVKKYLETLAQKVAKFPISKDSKVDFSSLSQTGNLVGYIRAILELAELNLPEQITDALRQIVDAYDADVPAKISHAFSVAAKVVSRK